MLLLSASQDTPRLKPLNVQEWITDDDYPAAALRAGHEGAVRFRLTVAGDGTVERCDIVQSSGFEELDTATCTLLTQRARFSAPRAGMPYNSSVEWKLPVVPPEPIAWSRTAGIVRLGADDQVISGENKFEGASHEEKGDTPCGLFSPAPPPNFLHVVGGSGRARTVTMEVVTSFDGMTAPPLRFDAPGQVKVGLLRIRFDVGEDGKVANCRSEPTGEEGLLAGFPTLCGTHAIGPYVPPLDAAGKPRAIGGTREFAVSRKDAP